MPVMSAAQTLVNNASGRTLGSYPSFGMSMRFAVDVVDLESPPTLPSMDGSLGLWQSCKNLQVELQYKKFAQGGESLVDEWLPEKLVYSPVTLERPMERQSSTQVQAWLQKYIAAWNTYPAEQSGAPPSTQVIITLLDYQLNEVMKWTLDQARPSKWMGPALSATDNKVAIETLVIDHSGFL
jgi:phage tail-like protein